MTTLSPGRLLGAAGAAALLLAAACGESPLSSFAGAPRGSARLFLEFETASVVAGGSGSLRAMRIDPAGRVSDAATAWRSGDESIVTVDAGGRLTGRGVGSTNVWARVGRDSVSALVSVVPPYVAAGGLRADGARLVGTPSTAGATIAVARWIAISSGTPRLPVTRTLQFRARAWDSAGVEIVPAPPLIWVSSQPNLVHVDSTGLASALQAGTVRISAYQAGVKNGPFGGVVVESYIDPTIPVTASVAVSPASVSLAPDASMQLAAAARTAAGETMSGRPFTWSSSNPKVATITRDGLLRAVAIGTATITVACDGKSATAAVVVEPPPAAVPLTPPAWSPKLPTADTMAAPKPAVASVVISPDSLTMNIGDTVVTVATALAATGAPLTDRTPTWTSVDPAVATVTSTGKVTAVAAGTGGIVATVDGLSNTIPVTVAPAAISAPTGKSAPVGGGAPAAPPPPNAGPAPGSRVTNILVTRFDGGSGVVTVSNGIPFPQGWVTESTLGQLHVFVDGREQKIFTRALAGRHKDGSLRAALVQFDYDIPKGATISGELSVGGVRSVTLAARATSAVPAAVVLPSSPAYLVDTRIGGLLRPAGEPAATPLIAQYEADYARLAAEDWTRCGAAWDCGRTAGYNRGYVMYQAWLRTADPKYWQHATAFVDNYLNRYIIDNTGTAPWWSLSEDILLHYWASGDERSRVLMRRNAESLAAQSRPGGAGYPLGVAHGDDRLKARVLTAEIDATLLGVAGTDFISLAAAYAAMPGGKQYYSKGDWSTSLTASTLANDLTDLLASQQANGSWGGLQYQGGQSAFMVGMLMSALTRYYDEISPDPRIPPKIKKTLEYMWANEWSQEKLGFKYVTHDVFDATGKQTHWPVPEPGLNGLIVPAFAWWAAHTTDAAERAVYRQRVDLMLSGGAGGAERSWWSSSGKAFDQAFYRVFNTFAWRD